jgi:hypothetical protein
MNPAQISETVNRWVEEESFRGPVHPATAPNDPCYGMSEEKDTRSGKRSQNKTEEYYNAKRYGRNTLIGSDKPKHNGILVFF